MSGRISVVVLGCGDIAVSQHLPALVRNSRFDIVAVADPVIERAQDAARRFSVPQALGDTDAALGLAPDAVVVATPPSVTSMLSERALSAGIHVLCEKPVAVTLEDADRLVGVAERSDAVLQVGFKNRFAPLILALRERVLNGDLGFPLVVRIGAFDERYDPADSLHTERINGFLQLGPPVVHEGAHSADLLGWLLGRPLRVTASCLQSRPEFASPNYHCALIEYPNGSLAKLEVGWWFPHLFDGELKILGPAGSADLSRPKGQLVIHDGVRGEMIRSDEDWQTACFRGQYAAFAEAVDTGAVRGADAAAGRDALDLTLAIVEAAQVGMAVVLGAPTP